MDFLITLLKQAAAILFGFLPDDPLPAFISAFSSVSDGLGWLNWLIPFSSIASVLMVWLVAIAGYYVIKALISWVGLS